MNYRIEQLRYQLREDPSSRAFLRLAALLREEGETTEAIDVLRRGLEHHPRSLAAWLALGRALADSSDAAGADDAFDRAHALDPGNAEAAQAVAESAMARDDWQAAAVLLEPVRGLAADDAALAALVDRVDARIAEQRAREAEEQARLAAEAAAEAEARRRRAERLARPPTDVVRLADGDPFANLTAVGIQVETEVQDVFAVVEEAQPVAEARRAGGRRAGGRGRGRRVSGRGRTGGCRSLSRGPISPSRWRVDRRLPISRSPPRTSRSSRRCWLPCRP